MTGNITSLDAHREARRSQSLPEHLRPYRRWNEAMAHVELANAKESVAWADWLNAKDDFGKDSHQERDAYRAYGDAFIPRVIASSRAMFTPAPNASAYLWKLRARKMGGGCEQWDAAIAADRARLKGGS